MPEIPEISEPFAIVTGASSGIGRATTVHLRRQGWQVLAIGRNHQALQQLAQDCGAETLAADVCDSAFIPTLQRQLAGRNVGALIHAAGVIASSAPFQTMPPEAIDAMVGTNLTAPLHLTRALLPDMVQRKSGHLIFIGSSAGRWPHPTAAVYGASKAAVSLFCDALRCDLLGSGVRVTEIAPGRVQTAIYRDALGDAARAGLYEGYAPMQPEHIAQLVHTCLNMPAHVDVSFLPIKLWVGRRWCGRGRTFSREIPSIVKRCLQLAYVCYMMTLLITSCQETPHAPFVPFFSPHTPVSGPIRSRIGACRSFHHR